MERKGVESADVVVTDALIDPAGTSISKVKSETTLKERHGRRHRVALQRRPCSNGTFSVHFGRRSQLPSRKASEMAVSCQKQKKWSKDFFLRLVVVQCLEEMEEMKTPI